MGLWKKLKKNTPYLNTAVHDTNTKKTFTSQLPGLYQNCFLTPAVTTNVYKQHNTVCRLLPAAEVRLVLLTNSATYFIHFSPPFVATKLSPEL